MVSRVACCMVPCTKKACYPSIERSFKNLYNGTMCCMLHGTMYEKSMLPLNRKVFQKSIQWYHLLHVANHVLHKLVGKHNVAHTCQQNQCCTKMVGKTESCT